MSLATDAIYRNKLENETLNNTTVQTFILISNVHTKVISLL